jgi:hypothetical protein
LGRGRLVLLKQLGTMAFQFPLRYKSRRNAVTLLQSLQVRRQGGFTFGCSLLGTGEQRRFIGRALEPLGYLTLNRAPRPRG